MAKKDNNIWVYVIIAALFLFVVGGKQGWFQSVTNINNPGNTNPQIPLNPTTQLLTYNVEIAINPARVCVGDSPIGTIDSNIPNGVCTVFANTGSGYAFFLSAILDGSGKWSQSAPANTPGTAYLMAVCCDRQSNCRISNVVTLIVEMCSTPPPADGGEVYAATCDTKCRALGYDAGDGYAELTPNGCYSTNEPWWIYMELTGNKCCCLDAPDENPGGFPCTSIFNPVSQRTCDAGYCQGGMGCYFSAATLSTPARCVCGI